MIELKDLVNKVHDKERQCIGFDFLLDIADNGRPARIMFVKQETKENVWELSTTLNNLSQMYHLMWTMPSTKVPLILVAATGLKYLQIEIQKDIQKKSDINFLLGEELRGM